MSRLRSTPSRSPAGSPAGAVPPPIGSDGAFFLARFFSLAGDQFVTFTIPVAVYLLTGKVSYAGAAFFIEWLPRTVALPLLGILVDRSPATAQMKRVDLARAGLLLLTCLTQSVPALMLAAGVAAMLNAYAFLLTDKLISTALTRGSLPANQAKLQTLVQVAKILGPAGAGLLVAAQGAKRTLFVSALLFCASLLLHSVNFSAAAPRAQRDEGPVPDSSPDSPPDSSPDSPPDSPLRSIAETARLLWSLKALRHLQLLTFFINLAEGVFGALLPVVILGHFKQTSKTLGYVNGCAAALSVGVLLVLVRRLPRLRLQRVGAVSALLMFLAGLVAVLSRSFLPFAAALAVFTAARNALSVFLRTERLRIVPKQWVGRALGLIVSCDLVAFPLAGALVAILGTEVSPFHVMLAALSASLLSTGITLRPLLTSSRRREQDPESASPES